jgi:tRNA A-37 threonylcarbamoyl transferase component Bud32
MSSVDLSGKTLCGRYQVEAPIGKGGMGSVYRATDENGRAVAIKVIGDGHAPGMGEILRARLRREAEAGARLDHPNVVRFYEAGTDAETGTDFVVMELLHGEDLRARLNRSRVLAGPAAVRILYEAASGLGALHRLGMVHRDFKPTNLFLERIDGPEEVRARVLDLGAVQQLDGGTVSFPDDASRTKHQITVLGRAPMSAHYAAPEQLRFDVELTPACDVFALGVTAYEVLTGVLPFTDRDRERMRGGDRVPPPSARARAQAIPRALDRVIARALEPAAADRYRDGDAFAAALVQAVRPGGDETWAEAHVFAPGDAGDFYQPPPSPRREAAAPGDYPPLMFRTDLGDEAWAHSPAGLAVLLRLNRVQGPAFLGTNASSVSPWRGVNPELCSTLERLAREHAGDDDARLACAIYALDPSHPYRTGITEVAGCLAMAEHLLENARTYGLALRSPRHHVWLYLSTRPEAGVRNGVRNFALRFERAKSPEFDGGASTSAALHALVVWLRGMEGETRLRFEGTWLSDPRDLDSLEGITHVKAAAALADPSSLLSAWMHALRPAGTPLVEKWRAAFGGGSDTLHYALGYGARVDPGEIRAPHDAMRGPDEVMAALWTGGDGERELVDAYLQAFHSTSLLLTAFMWLRDAPAVAHRDGVTRYVVERTPALAELLAREVHRGTVRLDDNLVDARLAAFLSENRMVESAWAGTTRFVPEETIAGEQWAILPRDMLPVLLPLVPHSGAEGERMMDRLATAAAQLLALSSKRVPLRLYRLGLWIAVVEGRLRRMPQESDDAHRWRRFLSRMDSVIAWEHQEGYREIDDDPSLLYVGSGLMRHAIEALGARGVALPFMERWRREERAYEARAAEIAMEEGDLSAVAEVALEGKMAAALKRRQNEAEAVETLRKKRRLSWAWLAILLLSAAGFFYFAPPVWSALADGLREGGENQGYREGFLQVVKDSLDGQRWYVFLAYFVPILLLSLTVTALEEDTRGTALVVGAILCVVIAALPQYAAALAPLFAVALLGSVVYLWVRVNRLAMRIVRARDAVAHDPAHLAECDRLRAASAERLREGQRWRALAARRAVALADPPEKASLPAFPAVPSKRKKAVPPPPAHRTREAAARGHRLAAARAWFVRAPWAAPHLALAAALVAGWIAVDRFAPRLPFWLTARVPSYVVIERFWNDQGEAEQAADAAVRRLRGAGPATRRAAVLPTRYSSGDVKELLVVLGPYGAERANRTAEAVRADGHSADVETAYDLDLW